jgi:O-acetyl-ADP-ribose deacetylase (regulator of RNase III)
VIELVVGDLTTEQVDAVVLPANPELLPGGGASGALHRAGGPEIARECAALGGCPTGEARATTAGRLPARYVIHAVGPVWRNGRQGEPERLAAAHRRSVEVAAGLGCRSISFPAISCGIYGYPPELAAPQALGAVAAALAATTVVERARFVFLDESLRRVFAEAAEGLGIAVAKEP